MAELSIGAAATVAFACAAPNVDWGVSITHFYLVEDVVRAPLPLMKGEVALPDRPRPRRRRWTRLWWSGTG